VIWLALILKTTFTLVCVSNVGLSKIAIQIRKDIYRKYHKFERDKMIFCTAVNCMDGRVQLPVINYLKERFSANYVDMITEPGPNGFYLN